MATVREGSAPNFCPPVEEGVTIQLEDEKGDAVTLEFLGLLIDAPALSSGEVVLLEVVELDEEGQPAAFELVEDEAIAADLYAAFQEATRDLYAFA